MNELLDITTPDELRVVACLVCGERSPFDKMGVVVRHPDGDPENPAYQFACHGCLGDLAALRPDVEASVADMKSRIKAVLRHMYESDNPDLQTWLLAAIAERGLQGFEILDKLEAGDYDDGDAEVE